MEVGGSSLCFLDLFITIEESRLETSVYSKPTDAHLYLNGNSCHPRSQILGIAKGVALRLRRICSKEEDFRAKSAEYANYLIECGHEKEHVLDKFREVGNISREDARKSKKKSNEGYCFLVTKYNPRGPDIRKIINKHHKSIICCDEKARDILPEKVIRVSFKRNANLNELLAPSNPYGKENTEVEQFGCFNCTAKRCHCCKNFLLEGHTFRSVITKKCLKSVNRSHVRPRGWYILPNVWLVVYTVLVLLLILRPALRTTSHTLSVGTELVVLSITSWIATGLIIHI